MTADTHNTDGTATIDHSNVVCLRVLRVATVAQLLLMLSTWPLWWGTAHFPSVSLIPGFDSVTATNWCSRVLLSGLVVLSVWMVSAKGGRQLSRRALPVLLCAVGLALLNQHRLQPWHWLFIMMTLQAWLLEGKQLLQCLRLTIVTIYVFSALSRITTGSANTMSIAIIHEAADVLLPRTVRLSETSIHGISHLMIIGEISIGVLLLVPRLRIAGIVSAVCMHVLLMAVLGPFGLKHHWGVLIWNLFLALCVPFLFCCSGNSEQSNSQITRPSFVFRGLVAFVVLFPLSGLFGIADNWLSWQVYSPRPETIHLLVETGSIDRLPESVRPSVRPALLLSDWHPVRLDHWSLAGVRAPLYPEDRFQLAITQLLVADLPDGSFRIEISRPAVPQWWQRDASTITRHHNLDELIRDFLLPAHCQTATP
jgi:hypothetical protein